MPGDEIGYAVNSAGDFNNDNRRSNIVIGAPYADANGVDSGAAYIITCASQLLSFVYSSSINYC